MHLYKRKNLFEKAKTKMKFNFESVSLTQSNSSDAPFFGRLRGKFKFIFY
jgi:hypothetical protein